MEQVTRDIILALRGFRRTPAFPVAVVAILSLGIGAAVAIFTAANAVLLARLPVLNQERIAVVAPYSVPAVELSPPATDLPELRRQLRTLSALSGVAHWGTTSSPYIDGERTIVLSHAEVTANYFDVLGAKATLGRLLRTEDEDASTLLPMVLSFGAWKSQFGGDSAVIGRRVVWPYTRATYTIVGVAPAGLDYPLGAECWTAMSRNDGRSVYLVGRMGPNVSLRAVQQEVTAISKRMRPALELRGATAVTLQDAVIGNVRPAILSVVTGVALLLLIACVNVGNLFLARAVSRTRELFVRRALGASFGSLVRQMCIEGLALAVAGCALGVLVAFILLRALLHVAPVQIPRLDTIQIDGTMVLLAAGVTALSAIVFAVLPSLLAARANNSAIGINERSGTASRSRVRMRDALVSSQVAIAVVLLSVTGLVGNSLARLQRAPLGFEAEHLAIATIAWDATKFGTAERMAQWEQQVEQRLRETQGVTGVTPILIPPFMGPSVWHAPIEAESDVSSIANATMDSPLEIGGPDYFATMGVAIKRGRAFAIADENAAAHTVVVSETVARRFWPNANALGKRIRLVVPGAKTPEEWATVVGVAEDTRYRSLHASLPAIYVPWRQMAAWQGYLAIRSTLDVRQLTLALQAITHAVDPTIVLGNLNSMQQELAVPLSTPRFTALLISAFGGMALLLASVGLFGVMATSVRDQTREIGIRSALGARPIQIWISVLRHGLLITTTGAALGLAAALATTQSLGSLLFEVRPHDPTSLAFAVMLLLLVGMLAAVIPAGRAARVDPMNALRSE